MIYRKPKPMELLCKNMQQRSWRTLRLRSSNIRPGGDQGSGIAILGLVSASLLIEQPRLVLIWRYCRAQARPCFSPFGSSRQLSESMWFQKSSSCRLTAISWAEINWLYVLCGGRRKVCFIGVSGNHTSPVVGYISPTYYCCHPNSENPVTVVCRGVPNEPPTTRSFLNTKPSYLKRVPDFWQIKLPSTYSKWPRDEILI